MTSPFNRRALAPLALCWLCFLITSPGRGDENGARREKGTWSIRTRRALAFEDATAWGGGQRVASPRKSGQAALRWARHTRTPGLQSTDVPRDLSAFNQMTFWLHSNRATDETFMVIVNSRHDPKIFSYFSNKVTVDWEGWKQVQLHFRSFGKSREPAGWNKVDSIRFTTSGWNQEPDDETVWTLDELDFSYTSAPYLPEIDVKKYAVEPARAEFLAKLRPDHPRLILPDEDLTALRAFIEKDERGRAWYRRVKERAESLYKRPVQHHHLPDGRRLLSISRDVVDRIYHWAFLYRMEGDRKWRDRAVKELEAVVAFPDWNPNHYLDTAEMMHAVAIGYDWLYNDLSNVERDMIRGGLWQHGLRLSHAAYTGQDAEGQQGWRKVTNNWNFVCNGGTGLAAMALLDEMPEECTDLLELGYQYIQIPLQHFEPDGAWWEGLSYWGYSMRYFCPYLRGLETAFGTDFGMIDGLRGTGFERAGDFPVYLVSPLGTIYNFADSGSGSGPFQHSHLFYLASRFQNPLYQQFQERQTSGGLNDLLYYDPAMHGRSVEGIPLDKHYRDTEVATMRSAWGDRDALFLGIKCGKNGIAHAHQDLGSFILYALGEKWLLDLGSEHQTYLGHQHGLPRYDFYRIREEGHNTLVLDPESKCCQDTKGTATITRFESNSGGALAVADLSDAYSRHVDSLRRGYQLSAGRRAVLVQDELVAKEESDVWWFAHGSRGTEYAVNATGSEVTLRRGDKVCRVKLLAPAGASLAVMDATPLPSSPNPAIQEQNEGVKKLAVHLPSTRRATIAVLFVPQRSGEQPRAIDADVVPLDDWQLSD